jgi:hypothetical protein
LSGPLAAKRASQVDMLEQSVDDSTASVGDGSISVKVPAYGIVNVICD